MSRSRWKGPVTKKEIKEKLSILQEKLQKHPKAKNISFATMARNVTITPDLVGFRVRIHNGKTYVSLRVTEDHVGHKLGEFAYTRKRTLHAKDKSKGKKR